MSGLKRLMNRTWSSAPAILSSRLFPPDPNLLIPPRRLTSTRYLDIYQGSSDEMNRAYSADISQLNQCSSKAKLLGLSPAAVRSGRKEPLQFRDGRRPVQDCGFLSASLSSSMIRSPIYLTNVAEFCTSSSSTTTTTKTTAPLPDNSNSETGGGVGGIGGNDSGSSVAGEEDSMSFTEAKRLMRLVNVEALKLKLGMEGKEVISYSELLEACESMGVARSIKEATAFARVLDEAGVVLLFRDKVYLHPDKVVDLVRKAVPLALTPENDPRRDELKSLQEKKAELDTLAHKQVLRILWSGLGLSILQVGLFFRLTFWEFSWDVMEPIAFFTTATGIVIGYAYFLFTRRDPSYQDLMKRLFLSRQRKLFKRQNFDVDRLLELERKCKSPLDVHHPIKNQMRVNLELGDAFHSH